MHLMPPTEKRRLNAANELETLSLSDHHLDYLGRIVRQLNPDMPASIGLPHLIRTILDRVERGEEITITRHGIPVARLLPVANRDPAKIERAIDDLLRLRRGNRLRGLTIRQLIEEGRR